MFEALLIVWINSTSNRAVMSMERFETVQACESARSAFLNKFSSEILHWGDPRRVDPDEVYCLPVERK